MAKYVNSIRLNKALSTIRPCPSGDVPVYPAPGVIQPKPTMNDIQNKDDLIILVNTFYDRAKRDKLIGPIFNTIIGDDWSRHLPVMYSFWNTVLFGASDYKGQAIGAHISIDKKMPLEGAHFAQWIALWRETVDSLFAGSNAEKIKTKAMTMLQLIQFKVEAARSGKSVF